VYGIKSLSKFILLFLVGDVTSQLAHQYAEYLSEGDRVLVGNLVTEELVLN